METRIQKYKNYRAQLIKEGSTTINIEDKPKTTTALPLKEVMDVVSDEEHNSFYKKQRRIRIIQFVLLVAILVVLIAGMIIFGVYAFGGKL